MFDMMLKIWHKQNPDYKTSRFADEETGLGGLLILTSELYM